MNFSDSLYMIRSDWFKSYKISRRVEMKFLISLLGLFLYASILSAVSPETVADTIINLYKSELGAQHYGEAITQEQHALQAAYEAQLDGADDEMIIAALLHDIGHICVQHVENMGSYGIKQHDHIGALFVRENGFSERVAQLIEGHVQAKRYLVYKNEEYYERLSPASKQTLIYQGGPMTANEAAQFEQDPLFKDKLKMRDWDERAKESGKKVSNIETYRDMIITHLKVNSKNQL